MPYTLQKTSGGYTVVNSATGRKHSRRPLPRDRAIRQMRALYAAEGKSARSIGPISENEIRGFRQKVAELVATGMSEDDAAEIVMRIANQHMATGTVKDAGVVAGAMAHGPGGMFGVAGLGGRKGRKWGNRQRHKDCSCGVNIATKEQIAPGITRIRGNLCNVHGRYGPCDEGAAAKKPKGKKPRKGRAAKPKKLVKTPEQRQQEHAAKQAENRSKVLGALSIGSDGQAALEALRGGLQPDAAAILSGGFEKAGLVERAADGSYRLTPSGRAMLSAAASGDQGRAADIISSARDRAGARSERQAASEARKQAAAQRRAEIEARRQKKLAERPIKKPAARSPSRSSGGKQPTDRTAERAQRESERQADRARKLQEHEQDRARTLQEHEQDRARKLQEQASRSPQPAQLQAGQATPIDTSRPTVELPHRRRGRQTGLATRTKASDPGDYLIVEDRTKPTTWHLQVRKGGKADHRLMGAAWAALHGGYRGNTYQGPNKQEAIGKLRKLYEREGMPVPSEKSFTVFKSADGSYRWIARSTTAYRDRDGEIITTKALEADAARMTATGQYGPLRYWHLGNPDPFDPVAPWGNGVDIGDCDYSIVIGRTSIESGTFKSAAIGKAFAENSADYELSPGFFHPTDQPTDSGEYHDIRRFERSVVPTAYGRASNLFTGMTVKDHTMDQETYEQRVKAFMADMHTKGVPPEAAASALAGMEQADKSATNQGVAFKSESEVPADPWQAVIAALKAAVAPPQPESATEKAGMAPASMEQAGATEMADGTADQIDDGDSADDETAEEGDYIGDMSTADFERMLGTTLQQALAPLVKGLDIAGKMASHMDELKSMMGTATKAAADSPEIVALKQQQADIAARLKALEGDQLAAPIPEDIAQALKGAPQSPPDPNAPIVPRFDPDRPFAGWTADLFPELYKPN